MIDSHCHLDHEPLFSDLKNVIQRSKEIGVKKLLTISTSIESFSRVKDIVNKDDELYKKFWPASVHLIGKDILRFHAIYWPAFLLAAKIAPPKKVYGHGWILSNEEKMSKSKGNILDPLEIIKQYGLDPLRYYLIKEVSFGNDGNISQERLEDCINSDLANNFGNLCVVRCSN